MKINYNIAALQTYVSLDRTTKEQSTAMERLSSGLQINSSKDDPAGMAMCQKLRAQIDGLEQSNKNSMDGISMIQTSEGALSEVHDMLARVRELSIQSMNDTYDDSDRAKLQLEVDALILEIDRISAETEFNENKVLAGGSQLAESGIGIEQLQAGSDDPAQAAQYQLTQPASEVGTGFTIDGQVFEYYDSTQGEYKGTGIGLDVNSTYAEIRTQIAETQFDNFTMDDTLTLTAKEESIRGNYLAASDGGTTASLVYFQTGANANQLTGMAIAASDTATLGLTSKVPGDGFLEYANENGVYGISLSTPEDAEFSLTAIDIAIDKVSAQRAYLGAYQNRLEHTVKSLGVTEENLTGSLSRIQDTDMAAEMAEFTRTNIVSQAATSMLAQANQRPQQVLQILQQ